MCHRSCDGGLFDSHAHTGGEGFGQANIALPLLVERMRQNNVKCAVLFIPAFDVDYRFDALRAELSGADVGFIPFYQPIVPAHFAGDAIKRAIEQQEQVFFGIGEIPFYMGIMQGAALKSAPWPALFTFAGQRKVPLMIHPTTLQAPEIAEMLSAYPDTKVILHGYELLMMSGTLLEKLLREHKNLYWTLDVATLVEGRMVRERSAADFIRWYEANKAWSFDAARQYLTRLLAAAPDRIMWGTDVGPGWNIEPEVYSRLIAFSRALIDALPAEQGKAYAYENARRLFGSGIVFVPPAP